MKVGRRRAKPNQFKKQDKKTRKQVELETSENSTRTRVSKSSTSSSRACACVPSERDKRETHELSVRQRTHRVFGTEGNKPGTARTQNPPEYQQSGEDPASQSTSYNNIVARTSPRFECVGFFVANSGLAHLGQLITRAGDVEKNPGPTL